MTSILQHPTAPVTDPVTEAAGEQPFYISATTPPSRPRKSLKHNDTFAVFDSHGDIGAVSGGPDGLFDFDTRFLSHLELSINGSQPLLLGSTVKDDNLHLYVDLTNPDIYSEGALLLPRNTVHISRTLYLRDGMLRERIAVHNHHNAHVALILSIAFDCDFADIFEVRGMRRLRRGRVSKRVIGANDIVLTYEGLDSKVRETALRFEPTPSRLLSSAAVYEFVLRPAEKRTLFVLASCRGRQGQSTIPFFTGLRGAHRERSASMTGVASIETSNATVNEVLSRAVSDFYMLVSATDEGPYPYAGIPWFSTTFGRDGIIAAMQMLWLDPNIARGVLCRLARYQALKDDPSRDAQPGKILHEMRGGEMAALREVPFGLYYGSADATPLFVMLCAAYLERTGDTELLRDLWPHIERALAWMDGPADRDGDGFLEYRRAEDTGLSNQGWKDSYDSVFHADGSLADGPIALVEVQAYAWAAKCAAAKCAIHLGLPDRGSALMQQAQLLRERFEQQFWLDDIGMYALALDGAKRPCAVRSSNAGHALFTGIASQDHACRVSQTLLGADFHTGWGVRTIAAGETRYNPISYHNGSVWPHDTAMIAAGLARYGEKRSAGRLLEGLCRAATYMDHRRLPELFCGFSRRRGRGPTIYPVACSPQAWASGAPFMIVQAMLGLEFNPAAAEIQLTNPAIPEFIDQITVRGLRLGNSTIDFVIGCDRQAISLRTLRQDGPIRITLVSDNEPRSR